MLKALGHRPEKERVAMKSQKVGALLVSLSLALGISACGGDGGDVAQNKVVENPEFEPGTTMASLAEKGEITIGTKFDAPGFGLLGLEDTPEGFEVEVGEIVAGALGIDAKDIVWKETTSDVREQVIENDEVDMVIATYTINDERKKRISFAGPYYMAGMQLMVRSENDTIAGAEDLKSNPDAKVCAVTGSTNAVDIEPYLANPDQLVLFDIHDKCASALEQGQVDAYASDNTILVGFVSKSDGAFKIVGEQITKEPYGIGIKKGDTEFCNFINEGLAENEDAYDEAWAQTAGKVDGTKAPTLPSPDPCS